MRHKMEALATLGDASATTGNAILAYLGKDASLAAIQHGKCGRNFHQEQSSHYARHTYRRGNYDCKVSLSVTAALNRSKQGSHGNDYNEI